MDINIGILNSRLRSLAMLNASISIYDTQLSEIERVVIMPHLSDCSFYDRKLSKLIDYITVDYIKDSTIIKVLPLNPENIATDLNPILSYKNAIPQGIVIYDRYK